MADTPNVRGFATPGDVLPILPGFDFVAPALQQVEQTKAPTVQRRYHFNRYKQIEALHQLAEDEKT